MVASAFNRSELRQDLLVAVQFSKAIQLLSYIRFHLQIILQKNVFSLNYIIKKSSIKIAFSDLLFYCLTKSSSLVLCF